MQILALDLATKTGWATRLSTPPLGTWTLATPKEIKTWGVSRLTRRRDPRVARLAERVSNFCGKVNAIIIEDVQFASSTFQVQLWSSLRAAVWLACRDCDIVFEAVPVTSLKKFATGAGNADKQMMMRAAQKEFPNLKFDDNAADAYHLLCWAEKNLSRII